MNKFLGLFFATLCVSAAAAAQDSPGMDSSSPYAFAISFNLPALAAAPPSTDSRGPRFGDYRWQAGFEYSYVRVSKDFFGKSASMNGINASLAYFLDDSFAIEGETTPTFGHSGGSGAHFLFYGGGVRIARRKGGRFEPWLHALVGGARFSPPTVPGTNSIAYEAGGGLDWSVYPQLSFRVQGDWIGTRLFNTTQNNIKTAVGIVIHF